MRKLLLLLIPAALCLFAAPRPAAAQCNEACIELVDAATGELLGYGCMAGGERRNCVARKSFCLDEPCESAMLTDVNGVLLAVADRCGPKPNVLVSLPISGKKVRPGSGDFRTAQAPVSSSASQPHPERLGLAAAGR